jgi:putative peptidoglycan lipid II flippase
MLSGVSNADRERDLRRLERDRRRREQGQPTYFDEASLAFAGVDLPTQETAVLQPDRLPARPADPDDVEERPGWEHRDVEERPGWEHSHEEELPRATPTIAPPVGTSTEAPRRRLAVSTAIFGMATALSRVLGLAREVVATNYFGATGKYNAFVVAFQLPNLFRALVADAALSSSFVPVFTDLLEKDRRRAWRVASTLFWLMLLGLTGLTAIFILAAPWVIGLFGNPGHDRALAVGLSRVLFPIVTLLGVSGIVVGILNSYDHFTVPALSPVFWNVAIIVGLAIGVPQAHTMNAQLYVYAFSILVATFIQVFLPMPWLRGRDGSLRMVLDWRDPAVKRVFVLMVPVTLGLGLINVNAVIDVFFASRYIDANLAPAAIQKAFLVYMLPQGMFSVAIATVLFPSLSRFASRGDLESFRQTVSTGLRQIAFLLIPAAVVSAILAEPIIRILFQRGHFHAAQTPVVAAVLAAFSAGLVFNGAMLMLNRAFFSLQSNWVPTYIALGNLLLNALLDLAFYRVGAWGIALATAVCNVAGTIALLVLLRKRLGRFEGGAIAVTTTKVVLASAAVAAVSWYVWHPLDTRLGRSFPAQVGSLGAALLAAVAVYLAGCRVLRVRELQVLLSLRSRLRRA